MFQLTFGPVLSDVVIIFCRTIFVLPENGSLRVVHMLFSLRDIICEIEISRLNEENQKVKANLFKGFNRSNCEQFYISFFYIVPLQHNAFVVWFN